MDEINSNFKENLKKLLNTEEMKVKDWEHLEKKIYTKGEFLNDIINIFEFIVVFLKAAGYLIPIKLKKEV